jgi:hypothetical protein
VFAMTLGASGIAVYAVICSHADAKGEAFPSTRTIARMTRLRPTTVRKVVASLVKFGLIEVEPRTEHGHQTSHLYRVVDMRGVGQSGTHLGQSGTHGGSIGNPGGGSIGNPEREASSEREAFNYAPERFSPSPRTGTGASKRRKPSAFSPEVRKARLARKGLLE